MTSSSTRVWNLIELAAYQECCDLWLSAWSTFGTEKRDELEGWMVNSYRGSFSGLQKKLFHNQCKDAKEHSTKKTLERHSHILSTSTYVYTTRSLPSKNARDVALRWLLLSSCGFCCSLIAHWCAKSSAASVLAKHRLSTKMTWTSLGTPHPTSEGTDRHTDWYLFSSPCSSSSSSSCKIEKSKYKKT
jgi:hypothetical protein